MFKTVGKTGMVSPVDALVVRQPPGSLRLEVEETLGESIGIIESSVGEGP